MAFCKVTDLHNRAAGKNTTCLQPHIVDVQEGAAAQE